MFDPTWALRSAIEVSALTSDVVTAFKVSSATGLFSMMPAMSANVSGSVERRWPIKILSAIRSSDPASG